MPNIFKFSNAGGLKSLVRYASMLAGNNVWNPWEPQPAMVPLATYTVPAGGQAAIEFVGIPAGYKRIEIFGLSRGATSDDCIMFFNNDRSSSYRWHLLEANGSSAYASNNGGSAATAFYFVRSPNGSVDIANNFAASISKIVDYSNTSKNKTVETIGGRDSNGNGVISLWSALYMNTNPITSITIQVQSGNLAQHSKFSLYGVR